MFKFKTYDILVASDEPLATGFIFDPAVGAACCLLTSDHLASRINLHAGIEDPAMVCTVFPDLHIRLM